MVRCCVFRKRLDILSKKGLFRESNCRSSPQGPVITIGGRTCVNFASNDYLGLASHPSVIRASVQAAKVYGAGAGASRLLGGGTPLHESLEAMTASFKSAEAVLIFNSGYAANTGTIPAIAEDGDAIFSDELNHASIIDGCRLSRAGTFIYRHRDIDHLEHLMSQHKAARRIIVTDSVFSMDGDIAPLPRIYELCRRLNVRRSRSRHTVLLYIDDAHATGVLGRGKGALAHFGINPEPWIIQMGTFSKALGSYGAFIAGSEDIIRWLTNVSRSFMFSTALPPSVVAASGAALSLIKKRPRLIDALWRNRALLVKGLLGCGFDIMSSETPILPVPMKTAREAVGLSVRLMECGIYAPAVRPPTVRRPRLRITVSSAHDEGHIEKLLDALKKYG